MGRYYSGDIEGKFWFAVQSSDDASFFGGSGTEPNHLDYYFCKDDLPKIKKGLEKCKKELGKYDKLLTDFFKKKDSYSDKELAKSLKVSEKKLRGLLGWYARKELGEKILKCVKKNNECQFEAEL